LVGNNKGEKFPNLKSLLWLENGKDLGGNG
jgi:hypothetical protein